ncbi:MAG: membrane fusion protein (multidrug efflux system), partial [Flavobacterium sp.]
MKNKIFFLSSLLTISLLSCNNKQDDKKENSPMPYKVVQVSKENTTLLAEYPTKLEGVTDIDIRP